MVLLKVWLAVVGGDVISLRGQSAKVRSGYILLGLVRIQNQLLVGSGQTNSIRQLWPSVP